MKDYLTIIIPTYNRNIRLFRLLKYFETVNFNPLILILDSSTKHNSILDLRSLKKKSNIIHYTYNDVSPIEKICHGIQHVSTPYALICADDDFISPNAILECISFLESHLDYYSVQGRYIAFWIKNYELIRYNPAYFQGRNLYTNNSNCQNRFEHFFSSYTPIVYSVLRYDILKELCQIVNIPELLHNNASTLIELIFPFLVLIYGNYKMLPIFYAAREGVLPYPRKIYPTVCSLLTNNEYSSIVNSFYNLLESIIMKRYSYSKAQSTKIVSVGLNNYLNFVKKVQNGAILREASKKHIKGEAGYPFYNNTQAIREWERMEYFIRLSLQLGLDG